MAGSPPDTWRKLAKTLGSSSTMSKTLDNQFYDRADAQISLANDHARNIDSEKVSASMMYATARYNCFISACKAMSSKDLELGKGEIIEYFVKQFQMMLVENMDDYIENYNEYIDSND